MSSDARKPDNGKPTQTPPEGRPAIARASDAGKSTQTPPEGRPAISRGRPSTPGSIGGDGPRSSVRGGAESETFGRIHRILAWIDANKGGFAMSRLISQTGVNLRSFTLETKDDAKVLSKIWPLLDVMLSEEERQALMKTLRDPG